MLLRTILFGRLGRCAAMLLCLGLSGCTNFNLRGDGYPDDELTKWTGQFRATDDQDDAFVWSNKGRQINNNFGQR
jgi:hypothetical protein